MPDIVIDILELYIRPVGPAENSRGRKAVVGYQSECRGPKDQHSAAPSALTPHSPSFPGLTAGPMNCRLFEAWTECANSR
jgi:hypothetical protein